MITRRGLIAATSLLAAPAVVRAGVLMPIRGDILWGTLELLQTDRSWTRQRGFVDDLKKIAEYHVTTILRDSKLYVGDSGTFMYAKLNWNNDNIRKVSRIGTVSFITVIEEVATRRVTLDKSINSPSFEL